MAIDTTKKIKQVTYNGTEIPLRGYDTSDATVTAGDIASGVIGYGKDGKVVGSLQDIRSYIYVATNKSSIDDLSSSIVVNSFWPDTVQGVIKQGAKKLLLKTEIQKSDFGNATAADVAKGKTFTSAAGLKVAGTAEGNSPRPVNVAIKNTDFPQVWACYVPFRGNMTGNNIIIGETLQFAVEEGSEIVVMNTEFSGEQFNLSPSGGFITKEISTSNLTAFIVDYSLNFETVELLLK